MPETAKLAPHAVYVPRQGEVNAWDNDLFVKTVRETGKKTLIMAGVWTSVCVMFPAFRRRAEPCAVFTALHESGCTDQRSVRLMFTAGMGGEADRNAAAR
jgi:isochorismate hydrolase